MVWWVMVGSGAGEEVERHAPGVQRCRAAPAAATCVRCLLVRYVACWRTHLPFRPSLTPSPSQRNNNPPPLLTPPATTRRVRASTDHDPMSAAAAAVSAAPARGSVAHGPTPHERSGTPLPGTHEQMPLMHVHILEGHRARGLFNSGDKRGVSSHRNFS